MRSLQTNEQAIDQMLESVGKNIILATPLGVGKPNVFLNDLYRRAKTDPSIRLTIYTALTLDVPQGKSDLENRFLEPFAKRVFGNYPNLEFEADRMREKLPRNIEVIEFYFHAGKYKNHAGPQQNYLSSNYTHVVRDLVDRGVNVICQQVAHEQNDGSDLISLSCNPDLSVDLYELTKQKSQPLFKVGLINPDLPFMYGESVVLPQFFDALVDSEENNFPVFAPPKMSVSDADYLIGLHASTLVKDDGEIQIGIGSLGDALAYALILRNQNNETYKAILSSLQIDNESFPVIKSCGQLSAFKKGLFASTEMLVDSFANLYQAKILKKKVYDSIIIQRLLNEGEIAEDVTIDTLYALEKAKAIHSILTPKDLKFLIEFGIFKEGITFSQGQLVLCSGEKIRPDINDPESVNRLRHEALGKRLRNGAVAHGGFFIGPRSFYDFLKNLPVEERKLFRMKKISQINQLFGHEEIDRLQRSNGRFINTCMKVTLNGSACSDALADGTQISGVGGQYNFVSMAHELPDARSILQLRSTRSGPKGKLESNIVFSYPNCTIPRHLRDIVITEYGIADLRGRTDKEVVIALIQIADSRFQQELIDQARKANKLPKNFKLNSRFSENFSANYQALLKNYKSQGLFNPFPLGTDLSEDEIQLGRALKALKKRSQNKLSFIVFLLRSLTSSHPNSNEIRLLERMSLSHPANLKERFFQKLLLLALRCI